MSLPQVFGLPSANAMQISGDHDIQYVHLSLCHDVNQRNFHSVPVLLLSQIFEVLTFIDWDKNPSKHNFVQLLQMTRWGVWVHVLSGVVSIPLVLEWWHLLLHRFYASRPHCRWNTHQWGRPKSFGREVLTTIPQQSSWSRCCRQFA